jgi:hypothetical protein
MRDEYSESNNSKMVKHALISHANLNMTAAIKIDHEDESPFLKYKDTMIGCVFESSSMGLKPAFNRLNQVLDSNYMVYSGPSDSRNGAAGQGKFRLKKYIDNNSAGTTIQW